MAVTEKEPAQIAKDALGMAVRKDQEHCAGCAQGYVALAVANGATKQQVSRAGLLKYLAAATAAVAAASAGTGVLGALSSPSKAAAASPQGAQVPFTLLSGSAAQSLITQARTHAQAQRGLAWCKSQGLGRGDDIAATRDGVNVVMLWVGSTDGRRTGWVMWIQTSGQPDLVAGEVLTIPPANRWPNKATATPASMTAWWNANVRSQPIPTQGTATQGTATQHTAAVVPHNLQSCMQCMGAGTVLACWDGVWCLSLGLAAPGCLVVWCGGGMVATFYSCVILGMCP